MVSLPNTFGIRETLDFVSTTKTGGEKKNAEFQSSLILQPKNPSPFVSDMSHVEIKFHSISHKEYFVPDINLENRAGA